MILTRKYACILVVLISVPSAAFSQVAVAGGLSKYDTARPGESYSGRIVLTSTAARPTRVVLRLFDYRLGEDGSHQFLAPGESSHSNAGWLTLRETAFRLEPGRRYDIPFTVDVPEDAAPGGTYWSLVSYRSEDAASGEFRDAAALVYTRVRID